MKHLFVPYELAILAKEKGFNEPCIGIYNGELLSLSNPTHDLSTIKNRGTNVVTAILYQQLVDWFREKYNIKIIENPQIGYDIYLELNENYFQDKWADSLNKALEEAFKLI